MTGAGEFHKQTVRIIDGEEYPITQWKAVYHGHHNDPRCSRLLGKTAIVVEPEGAYAYYRDDTWLVQFNDCTQPEALGWTLFPRSYFTLYPEDTSEPGERIYPKVAARRAR